MNAFSAGAYLNARNVFVALAKAVVRKHVMINYITHNPPARIRRKLADVAGSEVAGSPWKRSAGE